MINDNRCMNGIDVEITPVMFVLPRWNQINLSTTENRTEFAWLTPSSRFTKIKTKLFLLFYYIFINILFCIQIKMYYKNMKKKRSTKEENN